MKLTEYWETFKTEVAALDQTLAKEVKEAAEDPQYKELVKKAFRLAELGMGLENPKNNYVDTIGSMAALERHFSLKTLFGDSQRTVSPAVLQFATIYVAHLERAFKSDTLVLKTTHQNLALHLQYETKGLLKQKTVFAAKLKEVTKKGTADKNSATTSTPEAKSGQQQPIDQKELKEPSENKLGAEASASNAGRTPTSAGKQQEALKPPSPSTSQESVSLDAVRPSGSLEPLTLPAHVSFTDKFEKSGDWDSLVGKKLLVDQALQDLILEAQWPASLIADLTEICKTQFNLTIPTFEKIGEDKQAIPQITLQALLLQSELARLQKMLLADLATLNVSKNALLLSERKYCAEQEALLKALNDKLQERGKINVEKEKQLRTNSAKETAWKRLSAVERKDQEDKIAEERKQHVEAIAAFDRQIQALNIDTALNALAASKKDFKTEDEALKHKEKQLAERLAAIQKFTALFLDMPKREQLVYAFLCEPNIKDNWDNYLGVLSLLKSELSQLEQILKTFAVDTKTLSSIQSLVQSEHNQISEWLTPYFELQKESPLTFDMTPQVPFALQNDSRAFLSNMTGNPAEISGKYATHLKDQLQLLSGSEASSDAAAVETKEGKESKDVKEVKETKDGNDHQERMQAATNALSSSNSRSSTTETKRSGEQASTQDRHTSATTQSSAQVAQATDWEQAEGTDWEGDEPEGTPTNQLLALIETLQGAWRTDLRQSLDSFCESRFKIQLGNPPKIGKSETTNNALLALKLQYELAGLLLAALKLELQQAQDSNQTVQISLDFYREKLDSLQSWNVNLIKRCELYDSRAKRCVEMQQKELQWNAPLSPSATLSAEEQKQQTEMFAAREDHANFLSQNSTEETAAARAITEIRESLKTAQSPKKAEVSETKSSVETKLSNESLTSKEAPGKETKLSKESLIISADIRILSHCAQLYWLLMSHEEVVFAVIQNLQMNTAFSSPDAIGSSSQIPSEAVAVVSDYLKVVNKIQQDIDIAVAQLNEISENTVKVSALINALGDCKKYIDLEKQALTTFIESRNKQSEGVHKSEGVHNSEGVHKSEGVDRQGYSVDLRNQSAEQQNQHVGQQSQSADNSSKKAPNLHISVSPHEAHTPSSVKSGGSPDTGRSPGIAAGRPHQGRFNMNRSPLSPSEFYQSASAMSPGAMGSDAQIRHSASVGSLSALASPASRFDTQSSVGVSATFSSHSSAEFGLDGLRSTVTSATGSGNGTVGSTVSSSAAASGLRSTVPTAVSSSRLSASNSNSTSSANSRAAGASGLKSTASTAVSYSGPSGNNLNSASSVSRGSAGGNAVELTNYGAAAVLSSSNNSGSSVAAATQPVILHLAKNLGASASGARLSSLASAASSAHSAGSPSAAAGSSPSAAASASPSSQSTSSGIFGSFFSWLPSPFSPTSAASPSATAAPTLSGVAGSTAIPTSSTASSLRNNSGGPGSGTSSAR